jgi:3-oxoadipate enol-lactonase
MPTARVNDIDIYYEQHGDPQGEPLLLIMGFVMNAGAWGAQIPALAERYHVTAFDNRGAGRSAQPDGAYTMPQFVADTAALMDELAIERAHIIGASMGGMIAQEFALAYPKRVRSLVLMCTTPGGPHSAGYHELALRAEEAFAIEDIAASMTPERARDFALELFTPEFLEKPGPGFLQMAGSTMQHPSSLAGMKGQMRAILGHDTFDRLHEIAAPTLVLAGDADPMILPENSRILASRIPNAELELFPALRHGFNAEQPERVNRAVLEFLARHAAQPVGSAADA